MMSQVDDAHISELHSFGVGQGPLPLPPRPLHFFARGLRNTEAGQRRMLSFAGYAEADQRIHLHQKLNALHNPQGEIQLPEANYV